MAGKATKAEIEKPEKELDKEEISKVQEAIKKDMQSKPFDLLDFS